jgi:hypothetical protein
VHLRQRVLTISPRILRRNMVPSKFKLVSEFSACMLQSIEANLGCISQRRICSISDLDTYDFQNMLMAIAVSLQIELDVVVYSKENQCKNSKSFVLAVYWSSVWVYLVFYKKKNYIHVMVMYRKKQMDGIHNIFNEMSQPLTLLSE